MQNSSEAMKRFIQEQNTAIQNDADYPLNDFQNKMKVGNLPSKDEMNQITQGLNAAVASMNGNMPPPAINEYETASDPDKKRTLDMQRKLVRKMRENSMQEGSNNLKNRPFVPPSQGYQQSPQTIEQARATRQLTSQERSILNMGRQEFSMLDDGSASFDDTQYENVPSNTNEKLPPISNDGDDTVYEDVSI